MKQTHLETSLKQSWCDLNIEPEIAAEVTTAILEGSWTDAGTTRPKIDGSSPMSTFSQKGMSSRIDSCLLNNSATNLFWDFIHWDHKECTIPNHKLQCLSLQSGGKTICEETFQASHASRLQEVTRRKFIGELGAEFDDNNVEGFWIVFCRLAERWLVHHCAIANADDIIIADSMYLGRGVDTSALQRKLLISSKRIQTTEVKPLIQG